jgi:hypothetical protein
MRTSTSPGSRKPPEARLGEVQMIRPETSATRVLSVRGITVPWASTASSRDWVSAVITRTRGRRRVGGCVLTVGRATIMPRPPSVPRANTSMGSTALSESFI